MDDQAIELDFSEPVPLFPLPHCVLLPHATIPLHVFEPRYRRMVADALEARPLIAMALFRGDDWKQDYEGSPPLRRHVCVGAIIRHDQLADGRYHLLLQGLCRARIVEEIAHDPYRMALLEPTERDETMEIDLSEQRRRLDELLRDDALRRLAAVSTIHHWLSADVPTLALVDLASMALCGNSDQRYELLAEPDAASRAKWLERQLRDTRRTVRLAEHFRPKDCQDGITLN